MLFGETRLKACKALLLSSATVAVLGPFAASAAHAEDAIETVMVTSRRVSEDVQRVPLTVNVLTPDSLSNKGIENLSQINGLLPNVVWEDRGGSVRTKISIRGISSGETNTGIDPGVGFYIDDVYLPNGIGFNQSLLDISRVEVLKGPQGTLFGRNTTAGVISIHTEKPATDDTYVRGSATVGDYGLFDGRAVLNVPLSDDSAIKFSGIYRRRSGYDLDVVTKDHVNGEDHYGGRAQFLYEPNETFNLLASADYFKDSAPQDLPRCGSGLLPGICPSGGPHVLAANPPNSSKRNMWGTSLEMNWTPSSWGTITSITAYQHLDADEDQDQDAVTLDLLRSGFIVPRDNTITEELRLTTPQDKALRGILGAYYLNEDKESNTPLTATPLIIALGNGPTNGGHGIVGNTNLLTLNTQKTESFAVFGQGQYDITQDLTAEVGLRYTWDSKSFDFAQTSTGTNLCFGVGSRAALNYCPFAPFSSGHSWSALSGTASLSYRFSDNGLTYVRYSRGYKSGGWNGNELSPGTDPTVPFDPEYLDMVEVGAKYETSDHRLRLNGALFHNSYTDMQLRYQDPITLVQFIANAGSAKSEGLELEGTWLPFEGLVLDGNLGLQSTKITKVASSPALAILDGKPFPFAPRSNASLTSTYTHGLWSNVDGMASVTVAYRSDEFIDSQSIVKSRGFTQLNARIGIESQDDRWGVYLSGKNLTDVNREVYYLGSLPWASNVGFYNAPRTVEVQVNFQY